MTRPKWIVILVFLLLGTGAFAQTHAAGNDSKGKSGLAPADASSGTSGSELRLDPQALIPRSVTGPLNSKWLHPYGGVDYHFTKSWTGKAYWHYYGYHEDPTSGAVQDTYAPRNFRANLVTLSLRYAF